MITSKCFCILVPKKCDLSYYSVLYLKIEYMADVIALCFVRNDLKDKDLVF